MAIQERPAGLLLPADDALPLPPELVLTIRTARLEDSYPILRLHSAAFADQFGAAFGRQRDRGIDALADAWRRQGSAVMRGLYLACLGDEIVGTIALRTSDMRFDTSGATEIAFHRALGPWGAMRSMFALSLIDHRVGREEGFISDVAVSAAYQRRGIARLLLAHVEREARARRCRYLGLYVSAANLRARALYQTAGFTDIRTRRSLLALLVVRQYAWNYMRKPVAAEPTIAEQQRSTDNDV